MLNYFTVCASLIIVGLASRWLLRTRLLWQWLGLSATIIASLAILDIACEAAAQRLPAAAVFMPVGVAAGALILIVQGRRAARAQAADRRLARWAPMALLLVDRSGRVLGANRAARDLRWADGDIVGIRLRDLLPEEVRDSVDAAVRGALSGDESAFEFELGASDSVPTTWRASLRPAQERPGPVSQVAVGFADITQSKTICETLRQKVNEQTILLDNAETQIWYLTDPQTYGTANDAHARFVGHPKEELERRNIYDIVHAKLAGLCVEGNAEAFKHKRRVRCEVEIDDPCGETRYLSVVKTPWINKDGEVDYVVCTAQDVTEHQKAEAGLRMQTSAINAASDQIIITDIAGRIEFANPAFVQETGYSLDEVVGKNPRFLKSGEQDVAFYALLWNTILNGKTWHGEVTNRRKDGSHYVAQMTITPVKNDAGAIERFVAITRNITERKLFEQRMDYLAHHDLLTGLPNRLLISHRLTHSLGEADRKGKQVGVLFLDLDGFKFINDTMGHKTGDVLLKQAADRLATCCEADNTLARMGGDEFVIVLPLIERAEDAAKVARRVLKTFSKAFVLDGQEVFISASVGISLYPAHGRDVEALVKNADAAMYHAKELGRDSYYFFGEELNAAAAERMAVESSLRRAIDRQEFVVHYQPRVDVATGAILGAEALVRWRHPDLGLVFPDQFVAVAEDSGLIVPISEWVLRAACAQARAWQDAGLPPVEIAVNLSARQFQRRNALTVVRNALKESGLDPRLLEIELTESTLMQRPERAAETLNKLKAMGVRISVDDFGTGYSSLSYLKRFPVDALKIDHSFIRDITTNPDDAAITRAVVAMAHSLNLRVVAEGVETLQQLQYLFDLDCDEMQGYFVSAAVSAEDFEELLRQPRPGTEASLRLAA